MKMIKEVLFVLAMSAIIVSRAQETTEEESSPEVDEDSLSRPGRAALPPYYGEWQKNNGQVIVPYLLDDAFDVNPKLREVLETAIEIYSSTTCVRFVPQASAPRSLQRKAYITFVINQVRRTRCEASIGRYRGSNTVTIGAGCGNFVGIVLHELMHTLGFWHEQVRTDRDRYVTINWHNIRRGSSSSFRIRRRTDNFGSPYDVQSIMHYDGFKLSRSPGVLPTILNRWTRQPIFRAGAYQDRTYLSNEDIRQIHAKYHCPLPANFPARTFPALPAYDQCRDEQTETECARLKAAGNCGTQAGASCRLTCGSCLPCDDNRYKYRRSENGVMYNDCREWFNEGLCESEAAFMRAVCRRTCGWCDEAGEPEEEAEPSPPTTARTTEAPVVPVAPAARVVPEVPVVVSTEAPAVNNNRPFAVPAGTCKDQSVAAHCHHVVNVENCGKNAKYCRRSCGICQ